MMKKKVLLLFSAAPPSSLSTIRDIREISSLSIKVPSSLSNTHSPPAPSAAPSPSLSTIRDIREIRSLSKIVPTSLSKNKPRPTIRVHPTHMYLTFVTFEKFVVFQVLVRFYSIEKV